MINASRWANAHVISGSTSFYVGSQATLVIGRGAGVSGSRIVALERIEIGDKSLIGGGCLICDSDMHEVPLGNPEGVRSNRIRVGSRVFIGAGSMLLKGVTIGDGAVVGAGSVVSRDVFGQSMVAGNPARTVKRFDAAAETQ